MSDAERWSVTYTKQINKKRAVYQDGFLEIQSSRRKATLYDEFDKLLESKFIKISDVIRPGGTLTFNSYLVDIGEQCGGHEPVSTSNLQGKDKKVNVKLEKLDSQEIKKNPTCGRRASFIRPAFVSKKPSVNNLSPSQKIIRDFKKNEMNKYGSSPSCLDMKQPSTTKWQVMYTAQITQKAKKFHDGVMCFVDNHGALGRKVMLYDEYERLLDSKFLKKEVINTGVTLAFDSYLVEIGDKCVDNKHEPALNYQGEDKKVSERKPTLWNNKAPVINLSPSPEIITDFKAKVMHNKNQSPPNCLQVTKSSTIEWQVTYTTQITQKAKTFHDGVLQLVVREGSQRGQVTLLAEDGTVLGHRHLKPSEDVRTGTTLDMPKYLIEVGECRDDASLNVSNVQTSSIDDTTLSKRAHSTVPFCIGKSKTKTSPCKLSNLDGSSFQTHGTESSRRIPASEPKRSANAILSILRKPAVQDDFKPMAEDLLQLHVSDIHSDMKIDTHAKDFGKSVVDISRERTIHHSCNTNTIKSEAVEIPDADKPIVHEAGEDSQENLSGLYIRSGATDAMMPTINAECDNNHFNSSAAEACKVVTTALDPESQASIASTLPLTVSKVKVKLENSREINLCPDIRNETSTAAATIHSSFNTFAKAKSLYEESSSEFHGAATVGVDSNSWNSRSTSNVEENTYKYAFLPTTDDIPSFDLGF